MKIDTSNVKKGTVLSMDGGLYKVTDMSHTHMGRQGATYSFKVKEITTGKTKLSTYNAGTILEEADVQTLNAVFLYKAGQNYSFMENDTGEMHEIDESMIDDITGYLKENLDVYVMIHEGNVI